jgi:hypothetical protein
MARPAGAHPPAEPAATAALAAATSAITLP